MQISSEKYKHCCIVTVKGRVDSSTAPQFLESLKALTGSGCFKLVLDMSSLEYMSSAGYRGILEIQKICKRYNRGELILAAVPEPIQQGLEVIAFTMLFKILPDPLEAVGAF